MKPSTAPVLYAVMLLLVAMMSSASSCQPEPVEVSGVIRPTETACEGHAVRLITQPGSPTLTVMIARPDGSVPAVVFERVGTGYALQASPGQPISGMLGAVDCGSGGVRLIGAADEWACVAEMVASGVCLSP